MARNIAPAILPQSTERAKAIGAKGFVDKPFHQEQLLKVFEEALS